MPPQSARRDTGPGAASASETPRPLASIAGAVFGTLSRLRGARVFHPDGVAYTGTLHIERPQHGYPGVPLLERAAAHPALVRFSRGAGLPEPLPDVLGLALRLPDVHGRGRHQDFLLVTSADAPLLHHLLLPSVRGFFGQSYSSILLYRIGPKLRLVGAEPVTQPSPGPRGALPRLEEATERGAVRFRLGLSPLGGRMSAVGELEVGERLPDPEADRLAFTPWNTGGGIRPTGPFMGVRQSAYRASQRARGLAPLDIP